MAISSNIFNLLHGYFPCLFNSVSHAYAVAQVSGQY
jgi:hypothetical protein